MLPEFVVLPVTDVSNGIANPPLGASSSRDVPRGGEPSKRPLASMPMLDCAKAEPAKLNMRTEVTAISLRMIEIPSR